MKISKNQCQKPLIQSQRNFQKEESGFGSLYWVLIRFKFKSFNTYFEILVLYQCLGISATEDVDVTPDTIAAELGDDVNLPCQVK